MASCYMTMPSQPDASAWVAKAEGDLGAAVLLFTHGEDTWEPVCFHCQQAAEKYLKAVLAANKLETPKIHALTRLIELQAAILPELLEVETDAAWLSFSAVEMRYPLSAGLAVTRDHAERALRIARQIKSICQTHLSAVH